MLRVDQLIARIREWTENEDSTTTSGISDRVICEALSDGQEMLQGAIIRNVPECSWFNTQTTFSVTAGQDTYALPTRALYSDSVRLVEFSFNGQSNYYTTLNPVQVQHLSSYATWPPCEYAIQGSSIVLSPPPSTTQGTLRVTYLRRVPSLSPIVGQVTSLVSTSLTLDNDSYLNATFLSDAINLPGYFSASTALDGYGVTYNIAATAYNSGTRVLTVGAPTYEAGYSASDLPTTFLTYGAYSTHLPQWAVAIQPQVERYLRAYGVWKILGKDSSDDRAEQGNELTAIEGDIINAARSGHGDYQVVTMEPW